MLGLGAAVGGIGSAIGGIVNLVGGAGKGGEEYYRRILELYQDVEGPEFDYSDLPPSILRQMAQQSPELYDAGIESDPMLAQDSGPLRDQLGQNINYFEGIRDEGLPLSEKLRQQELQNIFRREQKNTTEGALRKLARQGRRGPGTVSALHAASGQQAADSGRGYAADLIQQEARSRMHAADAIGRQGGALRSQDIGLSAERANQFNRFNEFVSNLKTNAALNNASARERAQAYNVGTAQRIGDENVFQASNAALSNLNRRNRLRQDAFQNEMQIIGGQADALSQMGGGADSQQASRQESISDLAGGLGGSLGQYMTAREKMVPPRAEENTPFYLQRPTDSSPGYQPERPAGFYLQRPNDSSPGYQGY